MEPGRVLAERYELETEIGSGGAAVVWRAHDRSLGRTVAIKLLHPATNRGEDALERFRREARSAASLNHRNAVAIYDIGEDEEDSFIVMEYVSGPSLDQLTGRALDPDLVTALGYQVAAALGAAHRVGLIHRDVKPANILLNPDGQAKVADFGIAKAIDTTHTTLTQAGSVVGTVAYLAPEQIRGTTVDARTDVYALGLVLHETLTGAPPFGSGTPAEVTARRLATDPPPLDEYRPDIPEDLALTVEKASRLDPDARFGDGAEFAAALERLLRGEPRELVAQLAATEPTAREDTKTRELTIDDSAMADTVAVQVPARERATGDLDTDDGDGAGDDHEREGEGEAEPSPPAAERDAATPPIGHETHDRGQGTDADRVPAIIPERDGDRPPRDPLLPDDVRKPVLVVMGVAAAILVGVTMFGGDDGNAGGSGGKDDGDQPQAVEIVEAGDFDPFGDGEEHAEDVAKAHDGDPSTVWDSEHYDSADMGGLKPGVGLWLDLGASHDLSLIETTLGSPGIGFEVFVGDERPDGTDPSAWGTKVDSVSDAPEAASIDVPDDVSGRYVLLWITSVGGAGQQAEVAEVRVLGR